MSSTGAKAATVNTTRKMLIQMSSRERAIAVHSLLLRSRRLDQFRLVLSFMDPPPTAGGKIGKFLLLPRRPKDRDAIGFLGAAESDEQPPLAGRQIAAAADDEARLPFAARLNLHPRADGVAVASGGADATGLAVPETRPGAADQLQPQPS